MQPTCAEVVANSQCYLECAVLPSGGVLNKPHSGKMPPSKLAKHHVFAVVKALAHLDWMVAACQRYNVCVGGQPSTIQHTLFVVINALVLAVLCAAVWVMLAARLGTCTMQCMCSGALCSFERTSSGRLTFWLLFAAVGDDTGA